MYRYKIKQGFEERVFAGDGVKNIGDGTVESDHELSSPLLTTIADEGVQREQTQMTATTPAPVQPAAPLATPAAAPATPVTPPPAAKAVNEGDAE